MRLLSFPIPLTFLALVAIPLAAQSTPAPKTVLDYYQLLPKEELALLETAKSREALLKTKDVANGFLGLESDSGQGFAQVAVFRKKDRSVVVGVSQMECGPICVGSVKFLQYQDGKWQDVTDALMPKATDEQILAAYNRLKKKGDDEYTLKDPPSFYWDLPRTGTTVRLLTGDSGPKTDKVLMRFTWDGTRFTRADK